MPEYTVNDFAKDSENIVRAGESDIGMILRLLKPKLERLLESKIPEEAFIPRKDRYAMNLAYMPKDRIFSITSGIWTPVRPRRSTTI